jgi:hypothetical protein
MQVIFFGSGVLAFTFLYIYQCVTTAYGTVITCKESFKICSLQKNYIMRSISDETFCFLLLQMTVGIQPKLVDANDS